mgnify:FL=1
MEPLQKKYPQKINIYNLKYFFNFKPIPVSQILPGMLIQFNYRSPEGVHDVKPLIYVLEVEQDRVWGINIHYNFKLLEGIVANKINVLSKIKPTEKQETDKETLVKDPSPRQEQLNKKNILSQGENEAILNKDDKKTITKEVKPVYPTQLLETYTLQTIPSNILRNYLYPRTSSINKLTFKTL